MTLYHHIHISPVPVEVPYVKVEGSQGLGYRPYLPITFSYKSRQFPAGHALVDTGSDITILPLYIAHLLEIELDDEKRIELDSAGGGSFSALPSLRQIGFCIERKGFRPIQWEGTAYFAEHEPVILLGHHDCLEKFDVTFHGPERKLSLLPRF